MVAQSVITSPGLLHNHACPARSRFDFPAPFFEETSLRSTDLTIARFKHAQVRLKMNTSASLHDPRQPAYAARPHSLSLLFPFIIHLQK